MTSQCSPRVHVAVLDGRAWLVWNDAFHAWPDAGYKSPPRRAMRSTS
jgi:hypothetical protein